MKRRIGWVCDGCAWGKSAGGGIGVCLMTNSCEKLGKAVIESDDSGNILRYVPIAEGESDEALMERAEREQAEREEAERAAKAARTPEVNPVARSLYTRRLDF